MEWKIVVKHKELPDKVEIIGMGSDPHNPIEVTAKSFGTLGKRALERIRQEMNSRPTFLAWLIKSERDLYLWRYAANKLADSGEWIVKDNLPEVKPPRMPDSEDGVTLVY
ncbi:MULTISPECIES: hypothetical protein [unclassified Archaeoglobus]|jgi:hypothetical protein|uniref:hypothetical protein n=1 Tax=unclassified Archaeoglobus TaxID=2643606 RepID=UPI0025B7B43D|nr:MULTISPECIES: hypothetical protein [unclassified Archaeoglobus]